MEYEFIKKQLESGRQELSFNASSLSDLSLEKRKEIEEKILNLCLMQNKTAFEYIPYIKTIDVEKYFDEIDYFSINNKNLVYLFLYFKTKNYTYLNKIDYKEIDIDMFTIMVKFQKQHSNDHKLFDIILDIISLHPQYSRIYNAIHSNDKNKITYYTISSGILGYAVGDALGVPVEFKSRTTLKYHPVKEMNEYGSHNVARGTWSDDTSMTIATIDSIIEKNGIDYENIMLKFCEWEKNNKYTATNITFDVGSTVHKALETFMYYNKKAFDCGLKNEKSNGNGSIMRMLPIAFYLFAKKLSENEEVEIVNNISSLTHAHEISKLGCKIFCDYVKEILNGSDKYEAYNRIKKIPYNKYYSLNSIEKYNRILEYDIAKISEDNILSSGYIVDTLEAVLWCTLNSNSYEEAVLKAVNLGNDTDTIGAITGGICGCIYGIDNIPIKWIKQLKKADYLKYLSLRYTENLNSNLNIKSTVNNNLINKKDNIRNIENTERNEFPEAKFIFIDDELNNHNGKSK